MAEYDKSSKWLIQHHGDSILRLADIHDIVEWRPLQAEAVQPRRLPDGLLEAQLMAVPDPMLFLIEIATDAEKRLREQMIAGMALVWLDCGKVPNAIAIILRPLRNANPPDEHTLHSELGISTISGTWRQMSSGVFPPKTLLPSKILDLRRGLL